MTGIITESEVEEKLIELRDNLDKRAQDVISSDPTCAEIKGNIAALEWRFGGLKSTKSEE